MAEVVEYRVERTIDDLNLLVEFGVFEKEHAKEILSKRENFEYALRRRTRSKLDYLKYIQFEIKLLESIEHYKKTILDEHKKTAKPSDKLEDLDHKILMLQAKKINEIVRSRCGHVSSLFRKLTTTFQFDKKLWLAYIEFAKGRKWNTRVSSLYWRLLRVAADDESVWILAAKHEVEINRAFDTARGLYLRAIRHHPRLASVWSEYFKMELEFMEVVDRRARIVFKAREALSKQSNGEIWAEKEADAEHAEEPDSDGDQESTGVADDRPNSIKPIEKDDAIISGHLPRIIYQNAYESLDSSNQLNKFLINCLHCIDTANSDVEGFEMVREFIVEDIRKRFGEGDSRISKELESCCDDPEKVKGLLESDLDGDDNRKASKKLKRTQLSKLELLYECHESNGLEATRKLFQELEKSVKNQTLSLYVGMIQVEMWQLQKAKKVEQLKRIRELYEKALMKFGKQRPKLWYEYLQLEYDHSKDLEGFERVNSIYTRAQATLEPSKVDRVIQKYTLLRVKSSTELDYSDYSDIED